MVRKFSPQVGNAGIVLAGASAMSVWIPVILGMGFGPTPFAILFTCAFGYLAGGMMAIGAYGKERGSRVLIWIRFMRLLFAAGVLTMFAMIFQVNR